MNAKKEKGKETAMADTPKNDQLENEENEELFDEVYTLTDENGNSADFGLIGEIDVDGHHYYGLIALEGEEAESDEYVIFRATTDSDGQELLETIEDDDEFNKVAEAFEKKYFSDLDLDE